jgi:hypothetical protein
MSHRIEYQLIRSFPAFVLFTPKADGREETWQIGMRTILTLRRNYENYGVSVYFNLSTMKQAILLAAFAVSAYVYLHKSGSPSSDGTTTVAGRQSGNIAVAPNVVIAGAPPSYNQWKTGPNAQTDLKTGPNAQTDFEPFAPSEQATWNQNPGYAIVSGPVKVPVYKLR